MLGSLNRVLYRLAPIALVVAATPAHAGLVTHADLTSWTAVSSGLTAIDFEGFSGANYLRDNDASTSLLIDGVGFDEAPGWDLPPDINVTLPGSVSALAVDWMKASPNALTSDTTIAALDLTIPGATDGRGGYSLASNVSLAGPEPVEAVEVCTMLLIGTGLVFFGIVRKLRMRGQAAAA